MEAQAETAVITPMTSSPPGRRSSGAAGGAPQRRLVTTLIVLAATLCAVILISVSLGAIHIPLRDLLAALFHRHPLTDLERAILLEIRLPRALAAALVGAALAVSGLLFQGLFRNPMADPYIIGASGGAIVGACFGIVFLAQLNFFGFSATALLAFAGALVTMLAVYALARTRGRTSGVTLLLAGFTVGTMLSNSTYLFEIFDPNEASGTRIVGAWVHGTIGVPLAQQLAINSVLVVLALIAAWPMMRRLNTLALGDDYAHQLGLRVEATRIGIVVVGSLLTALAVSLGGLISFAGLIIPHVARLLLGPDHRRLLPVTALAGAIFLVVADTLARTLFAPAEIPVGVLMAFLGGPFFLYLLRKARREYTL